MRAAAVAVGLALSVTAARLEAEETAGQAGAATAPTPPRRAERSAWIPDFATVETGGYLGLACVGGGYTFLRDVVAAKLAYGYTPSFHAGTGVHTMHLTLSLRPIELPVGDAVRIRPAYLGGGVMFPLGEDFFLRLPDDYPDGYYPPTRARWSLHAGLSAEFLTPDGPVARHGAFFELTTIDVYLDAYLKNREHLGLSDVVSSGFGYRVVW